MTKRMLIDATHAEETRVAIVSGNKLEEFDYESTVRKQLKGNIFLVKVTRVEPSLQAAFVDFGGNRHGFLPFPEIHTDYYRIPVEDREALLAEQRALLEQQRAEEEARDRAAAAAAGVSDDDIIVDDEESEEEDGEEADGSDESDESAESEEQDEPAEEDGEEEAEEPQEAEKAEASEEETAEEDGEDEGEESEDEESEVEVVETEPSSSGKPVEMIGGDDAAGEEESPKRRWQSIKRRYKIQEVIKRGQVMLIQVTKEERGNKGAAVTSYISLPGRYCVLMPNSPRGGGVSRKVGNVKDRQRLKKIMSGLDIPDGMSVIIRTAGLSRSRAEIKRDLDYLLRLWDEIREQTLQSTAPALIYEEGNLIKRAIRDLYKRDIDEVFVAGEEGFKNARDFMKNLMPSHVRRVIQYSEEEIPLFFRYQVESQIDEIYNNTVQLRSGGYIVINPTEALVSIDINSGRATRERHIEETALKTNLEAAEEIARQLRLRDLGGLVVIDFIDMEDYRNNRAVERRLKEAMSSDRARIQLGRISAFGLLELSRQRLRPSLMETHFETCSHCKGAGLVRTIESTAVMILRLLEEEAMRSRASDLRVVLPPQVAIYILNQKRVMIADIERRYSLKVYVEADENLIKPDYRIEKGGAPRPGNSDAGEKSEGGDRPHREHREHREHRDHGGDGNRRGGRHRRGGRDRDRNNDQRRDQQPHQSRAPAYKTTYDDIPEGADTSENEDNLTEENDFSAEESEDRENNGNRRDREPRDEGDEGGDQKRRRRRGRRGGRRRGRNRHDQQQDGQGQPRQQDGDPAFAPQPDYEPPAHNNNDAGRSSAPREPVSATASAASYAPAAAAETSEPPSDQPQRKGWWKKLKE